MFWTAVSCLALCSSPGFPRISWLWNFWCRAFWFEGFSTTLLTDTPHSRLHSHHHRSHGIYHVAMPRFNFGEYLPLPLYSILNGLYSLLMRRQSQYPTTAACRNPGWPRLNSLMLALPYPPSTPLQSPGITCPCGLSPTWGAKVNNMTIGAIIVCSYYQIYFVYHLPFNHLSEQFRGPDVLGECCKIFRQQKAHPSLRVPPFSRRLLSFPSVGSMTPTTFVPTGYLRACTMQWKSDWYLAQGRGQCLHN